MTPRPITFLVACLTAVMLLLGSGPALASSLTQSAATPASTAVETTSAVPATNEIVLENRKGGTSAWRLPWNGYTLANDTNMAIKGYATAASVNKGESIGVRVRVASPGTASYGVYRLGWYQGLGGRAMASGTFQAGSQPGCETQTSPNTGMITCPWDESKSGFTIQTEADWTTGVYVVVLTRGTMQNYVSFVVRDDAKKNAIVHLQSTLTTQAYNNFPDNGLTGKSLYPYNSYGAITVSGGTGAVKASFDRPYSESGAGFVMTDDAPMIRYAESRGFDMTYATDMDLHNRPDLLSEQVGMVSVGHDEYWTGDMFTAAEKARDSGVDLAFFGANNVYWQVRMEPSAGGTPDRVMVVYRDPAIDPVTGADATVRFRYLDTPRPEQTLMGQMWDEAIGMTRYDEPWVVSQADHWFYRGTGLNNGSQIPMLVGIEVDRRLPYYPEPARLEGTTTAVLASSYYAERIYGNRVGPQEATLYQAPSGALVFSAGTLRYPRGLLGDGPAAQQTVRTMTTNLFGKFQGLSQDADTTRIGGADRYETAVELSKYAFPGDGPVGVPVAYLATGANYPDALAAAAATQGAGPVLLVPGPSIPQEVLDELERLAPAKLEIVGGRAIVSDAVMEAASVAAGVTAERRAGDDRYETAAELSKHTFDEGVPVAYVATGANFPDALAAGAAGAQLGGPVLLTPGTALSPATKEEIERLKPQRIVIVGGSGVISNGVVTALDKLAPQAVRLSGADRYETALAVARDLGAPASADTVGLATALDFPDALAAGPVVAAAGGSLLLVGSTVTPGLAEELVRSDPRVVLVAGLKGAIPDGVISQLDALFAPPSTGTPPPPQMQLRAGPPGPLDTWRTKPAPYDDEELPWMELPPEEWQHDGDE
ncbi:cell wall-binding repeat-containing protein [Agromyces sp. H66]|uniref:cell wall-binding repeat-containing protein n=1 Tax=Agromyces sp. H66 TaxID=2529859 RepID=UPI0010AAE8F7|nr:cell wall-binding repeat-containing protein [Agromyces sp. H66]